MNAYFADLHIHTALSPCAADEMTPPAIVQAALDVSLAMIAICDHNAAGNAAAVQQAAGERLAVIAGIEVTTAEEVHVVGLFPDADAAGEAAAEIAATLPFATPEDARHFGEQQRLDANGACVGMEPRLLAAASSFALTDATALIHRHGGLAVAAHINRPSFSVLSQLGMIPDAARFDALEILGPAGGQTPVQQFVGYGLPLLCSSDSHFLGDIGSRRTKLELAAATFAELVRALRNEDGRRVVHA